jgi:osmotically-inducible protein OsmY
MSEERRERPERDRRPEEDAALPEEKGGDDVPPPIEESLEAIEADDVDVEADLAPEQVFDTQHGEGHTYNPQVAAEQGLTYTPPTDPPVVSSLDDPQEAEVAAGFAPSMEEAGPAERDLPPSVAEKDLDLQEYVERSLHYNSETAHLTDVRVAVNSRVVSLRGTVPVQGDIGLAYSVVREVPGVLEVRSYLHIAERP